MNEAEICTISCRKALQVNSSARPENCAAADCTAMHNHSTSHSRSTAMNSGCILNRLIHSNASQMRTLQHKCTATNSRCTLNRLMHSDAPQMHTLQHKCTAMRDHCADSKHNAHHGLMNAHPSKPECLAMHSMCNHPRHTWIAIHNSKPPPYSTMHSSDSRRESLLLVALSAGSTGPLWLSGFWLHSSQCCHKPWGIARPWLLL